MTLVYENVASGHLLADKTCGSSIASANLHFWSKKATYYWLAEHHTEGRVNYLVLYSVIIMR